MTITAVGAAGATGDGIDSRRRSRTSMPTVTLW